MNILYPALALIGLTLFCLGRLGISRYIAVRDGAIDPKYFRLYRGYEEPEKLRANSRHVQNLFEAPILFYAITLIAYVSEAATVLTIVLAWTYVILRYIHSYVHLTSNLVVRRFATYVISTLVLALMWANTIFELVRQ